MTTATIAAIVMAGSFSALAICMVALDWSRPNPASVNIMSAGPDADLTGLNGGTAFIPGKGLLVWDPTKYDLKIVERSLEK